MSIITVWASADSVRLHQLSDDPEDGTAQEQIAHLATLSFLEGFTCVSTDYQGAVPDANASLWRWDGSAITAVEPVPESITPRQCRLVLDAQGLLDKVEAMVKTQPRSVQLSWEWASEFKRNDPLLEQLATNLGITVQELDTFFIAAAAL